MSDAKHEPNPSIDPCPSCGARFFHEFGCTFTPLAVSDTPDTPPQSMKCSQKWKGRARE